MIYPLDSVICSLNNRDLIVGLFNSDLGGHCTEDEINKATLYLKMKKMFNLVLFPVIGGVDNRASSRSLSRPVPLTRQVPAFNCIRHWRVEMRSLYFILIQLAYIFVHIHSNVICVMQIMSALLPD